MIRFFKSTQPVTLLIIPIILLLFWGRIFLHSMPVMDEKDLPLWRLISSFLMHLPSWLNFTLLFTIVCAQVLYLNFMLNRHEVLYKNSFIPAFIFTLFISSTPLLMLFHPAIIINLLVIFILDKVFYLYKSNSPFSKLFDCGILAGIAALIYFPAFILLPFLLSTVWVIRPFRLKETMIVIVAFLIPFFYLIVHYFWNRTLPEFRDLYFNHFRDLNPGFDIKTNLPLTLLIALIILLFFLSSAKLIFNFRKNTIRTRSYLQVFLIYFLFGIAWLYFSNTIALIHYSFLIIPMVIFCSYYFLAAKRRIILYEMALLLWVALVVWNQLT